MGKQIIILGGNKLHRGFDVVKKKLNIEKVIVIDWNTNPDYVGDVHYQIDIKDFEAISRLPIEWDAVAFVYTSADIAVQTQIRLHRMLNFDTPSNVSVENALLKGKMRDCWYKDGILNKYSLVISQASEFVDVGYSKYIFKPNCSSGSRNITIIKRGEMTVDRIRAAIDYAKEASLDNKCIVEEFVEGTEYTVDMLGDKYGNVGVYGISKKYHTSYNKTNKIATKLHYAPSDVPRSELERIGEFGERCYKSLGLVSSFGHLEIIVNNAGKIVPVEIGARSSGYIATDLIDIITGKSYLDEYEKVLHGGKISSGLQFSGEMSAMYYFYDIRPGISISDKIIMDYLPKHIYSYSHDRNKIKAGRMYGVINADCERYGYEILGGNALYLNIKTIIEAECKFNDDFIDS